MEWVVSMLYFPCCSRKQITLTPFRTDEVSKQYKSNTRNPMSFNAVVANFLAKEIRRSNQKESKMILSRLQGDFFYGRVTGAVTHGFLSVLLRSVCLSAPPCTVQARQVCPAIWIWVSHYMPGWLQEKADVPQELRAVGQKVALFTLCRARVPPGCSELETIPWRVCCTVCSWSWTFRNEKFLFPK